MKKSFVNLSFILFCLTWTIASAELDGQEVDDSVQNKSRIEIDIGLDADDKQRLEETVDEIVSQIANRRGNQTNRLIEDEQLLRAQLYSLLEQTRFSEPSSGVSGFGALVAIVALCLTVGLPVIIVSLVLWSSARKRRQMMNLAQSYIEADKPIPEHLVKQFGSDTSESNPLHSGLLLILVGAAVGIFFGNVADWQVATLALIPIAIGVSRILYWKLESEKSNTTISK